VAKEARKNKENKVRLVRDKLFVNDKRVLPPAENSRQQRNGGQERPYQQRAQYRYPAETTYNPNRPMWSRTFTRSKNVASHSNSVDATPVQNRFAPLRDVNGTAYTPNQHAGKTKARSPLEDATSSKKQRDYEASDSDESINSTVYELDVTSSERDTQPPGSEVPLSDMDTQPPEIDTSDAQREAADDNTASGGSD